ncbi:unnamed protein product [Ostreobium quekettii]|uniref:RRM domain-containing protein n=1 Tax=Ostreobium quekettii TaxID=121088 RepID=A0A8S1J2U6_9CHLO|nr:unnamed protein product [Ostreobium quekettii]|eukprot:evm.model.scf_1844.2 EVM.evm.TU.scf_1844.2   scf_1844:25116-29210(+)
MAAAEQILAGSTQPPMYFPPANASVLQYPEGFGKDEAAVDGLSRSLSCLGLTGRISEEYMGRIDEEPTPTPAYNTKSLHSRSATDLPSLATVEEDVFSMGLEQEKEGARQWDSSGAVESPGSSGDRTSQLKISVHPSRTLICSNISSTMSDEYLKALFQTFGDVQTLRTEYRSHGIVVVSFFDLRAAFNAKRELQGRTLADQALQVQFSAMGSSFGNFGEGTILIFNCDPHLDCQELARIFSMYGDVKRIQEVPDKKNHKLIEFYDIRRANLAMQAINRAVVAGSQTRPDGQVEGAVPMQQAANVQGLANGGSGDLLDQPTAHSWDGSSRMKSLLAMGTVQNAEDFFGTGVAQGSPSTQPSTFLGSAVGTSSMVKSNSALALQDMASSSSMGALKVPPVPQLAGGALPLTAQLAKGLRISDSASSLGSRLYGRQPALMTNLGGAAATPMGGMPGVAEGRVLDAQLKGFAPKGLPGPGLVPGYMHQAGHGPQPSPEVLQAAGLPPGLLNNPNAAHLLGQHMGARTALSNSTSVGSGLDIYGQQSALSSAISGLQQGGYLGSPSAAQQAMGRGAPPVAANPPVWGQPGAHLPSAQGLAPQTATNANLYETISKLQQAGVATGSIPGLLANAGMGSQSPNPYLQAAITANAAQLLHQAIGGGTLPGLMNAAGSSGVDLSGLSKSASSPALNLSQEESREQHRDHRSGGRLSRRNVDPVLEAERRVQQQRLYALDIERVNLGEDKRTTLMIKNIPNKYTQKMLLASVDETLKGKYDFFYLPIDFKNKCNVGYGFINMMTPKDIIPVFERFHNKKWERFNSEKVCCITYARIQGKAALVNHFQNSSLMHEDKKHRPVLFTSDGPTQGDPEPFPVGPNVRPRITFKERDFRSREKGGYWG